MATAATAADDDPMNKRMTRGWIRVLGVYHVVLGLLVLYLLFKVWPTSIPGDDEEDIRTVEFFWGIFRFHLELFPERQILLLVLLAGALGSYVHAATSFVNFTGTRSIVASWRWWYGLRPFIGMALALGFYFVARAGFFSGSANTLDLNVIGFVAVAFIVGMFTKQATEKLGELFDVLFRVENHQQPKTDKLDDTRPPPAQDQAELGGERE